MGAITGTGGGTDSASDGSGVQTGPDRLERFEQNMKTLQTLLHNPKECEFTVVTIPTELATAESARLLEALHDEKISTRRVIINQVLPVLTATSTSTSSEVDKSNAIAESYLNKLRQGQKRCIQDLNNILKTEGNNIPVIQVPYFDIEVRTVYGLRVISNFLFPK